MPDSHLSGFRQTILLLILCFGGAGSRTLSAETWTIITGEAHQEDAAIHAAIEDLQVDGKNLGLSFRAVSTAPHSLNQTIILGDAKRNPVTARLVSEQAVQLAPISDRQGFEIRTAPTDGGRLMIVAGGSVVGDVYGLYWLWDRLRVKKRLVDLNVVRKPALSIRLTNADSHAEIRSALRHTATWVSGGNILDLVPWDVEPERSRNAVHRQRARDLIKAAHRHHLAYLAVCDEFSAHPAMLTDFGATLNPEDPAFWQVLQEKYRRLLRSLPELDGVRIRTGELTRVLGNYRPLDVMHEPTECDWELEQRYRTFVQKLHEVVVGEFEKIYFHRTWVTNATEQHSSATVFRKIFTEEVPTQNLYLSPYLSLADRWYYQPYNPTFNLTPHAMVVLLSTLDYHAAGGANVCPSFPGSYYQGGLQSILSTGDSNLEGAHFGIPGTPAWDTPSLTAYTAFRLAWDPGEEIREIAEDFAAIHVGREVAPQLAEVLLLSEQAYKDGIYVKPVAESIRGNTLPHLRLTVFQRQGIPEIDRGKAHVQWLRSSMYEPSKGRIDEAVRHLDHGLNAAIRMEEIVQGLADRVEDAAAQEKLRRSMQLTRLLVETNNRYIKTCFDYFRYREHRDRQHREHLRKSTAALKEVSKRFAAAPGFCYQLFGIDQLLKSADAALVDLAQAETDLATAPDPLQIQDLIAVQQQRCAGVVAKRADEAVKTLRWQGKVDGRAILHIQGNTVRVEPIQGDPIVASAAEHFQPLPASEVTVLVKDFSSRPIHPFVLEQPTETNHHTAKIYLFDQPPSHGGWEFEVVYLDEGPAEIGLAIPWE